MKKMTIIGLVLTAGVMIMAATEAKPVQNVTTAAATWERGTGKPNPNGRQMNFVDRNGDGICDTFIDADKNGKCDYFVDNNKDGFNDNPRHQGGGNYGAGHRKGGMMGGKGRGGR